MKRLPTLLLLLAITSVSHSAVAPQTGLNGTWYDPAQDGQGFVIHVIPESQQVFLAWFTYQQDSGEQMWLTGSGAIADPTIQLELLRPVGGTLADGAPRPDFGRWGTATLEFSNCRDAVFSYREDNGASGNIVIQRLTPSEGCDPGAGR